MKEVLELRVRLGFMSGERDLADQLDRLIMTADKPLSGRRIWVVHRDGHKHECPSGDISGWCAFIGGGGEHEGDEVARRGRAGE